MDTDDGQRPRMGVVVTLLDIGDGRIRLIMDDVSSDDLRRETSWKHEWFFTRMQFDSEATDEMRLSADTYRAIGESVMARLLALNGRVK